MRGDEAAHFFSVNLCPHDQGGVCNDVSRPRMTKTSDVYLTSSSVEYLRSYSVDPNIGYRVLSSYSRDTLHLGIAESTYQVFRQGSRGRTQPTQIWQSMISSTGIIPKGYSTPVYC